MGTKRCVRGSLVMLPAKTRNALDRIWLHIDRNHDGKIDENDFKRGSWSNFFQRLRKIMDANDDNVIEKDEFQEGFVHYALHETQVADDHSEYFKFSHGGNLLDTMMFLQSKLDQRVIEKIEEFE